MSRQKGTRRGVMEDLLQPGKIRKRGCSSSSSPIIQNCRFKRAILVGRLMGTTRSPAAARSALAGSPMSQGGGSKGKHQQPVSARKLAATFWEMNQIPSQRPEGTERMDRSGTGSRHRRASSIHRGMLAEHNVDMLDSVIMQIETRSRAIVKMPPGSIADRLKNVSNALTTSKELIKIINRVWSQIKRPSSSMPLISALHSELERGRLQINQIIHEQHSDINEINYLMKRFSEEKTEWEIKEQALVRELDVERKLRRRFESLNSKLGKELAQIKSSLLKAVNELEAEKTARMEIERVCEERGEELKLADVLCKERVETKLSEAKYQLEEKNVVADKLRNQHKAFTRPKNPKAKWR